MGFLTIKHILEFRIYFCFDKGGRQDDLPTSSLHCNGLLGNASVALGRGSSIFYSSHQLCNQKCPKLCINWGNTVDVKTTNARHPETLSSNA